MADSDPRKPSLPITCDRYVANANDRRCRHYLGRGGCALASALCVEWVKANPLPVTTGERGNGVERPCLTTGDANSFRALDVEVCVEDELGELWIVPAYTDLPRRELSADAVVAIASVLDAFPGARVVEVPPTERQVACSPS